MKKCKLGVFLNSPHPEMVESVALSGFDFVVVDMEHSPIGPNELYPLVLAAECRNLEMIVRIPMKADAYFKWSRDLNVSTIQVPHIETYQDAELAIKNFFFSPKGERGLSRFVRAANFSKSPREIFVRESNQNSRLILQIEGLRALDNLEQILAVIRNEASIFIGPYDLSQSLGMPGEIWDKKVVNTMEKIIEKCHENQVSVGTFTDSVEGLEFWSKKGVSFLQYASDLNIFINGASQIVSRFSQILGDQQ